MSHEVDKTEELRRLLVRGLCEQVGLTETMAMQFADPLVVYLQREHAGEQLYIPKPARQYDLLQITAQLEAGASVRGVCDAHCISRRTLHRLFPHGLPEPRKTA